MKKDFWDIMLKVMDENPDVYMISIGLGWPRTDEFSTKYPQRFIQTEASEATALDISVGLAYSGKIPVLYTITPFYLRAWETIRTYINHENLHVVMIGAGVDEEYGEHDGFSHSGSDIGKHFDLMENIVQHYPDNKKQLEDAINLGLVVSKGHFINIHR